MILTEAKFTKIITDKLRAINALVFAIVGSNPAQPSGLPDRYVHHATWQGWIEFKVGSNKLSKIQRYVLRELNERKKNTAFVLRYVEGLIYLQNSEYVRLWTSDIGTFDAILFMEKLAGGFTETEHGFAENALPDLTDL